MKIFYCLLLLLVCDKLSGQNTYSSEDFSFYSDGYKIAGTISYPSKSGRYPALILVWGSGPHTRDMMISGTPVFQQIADFFNSKNYAVVRIDKRGFGDSEGPKGESESVTTSKELSNDVFNALQWLKFHERVDTGKIAIIGHSEGAWIAEMVAARDASVKTLVLLGAHLVNGGVLQEYQMTANLKQLVEPIV